MMLRQRAWGTMLQKLLVAEGVKRTLDLLEDLRKLQERKHTLEVARDILNDSRVRDYACMLLD